MKKKYYKLEIPPEIYIFVDFLIYRTKCEILFLDFSFSIKLFFFKKTQTQNRIICKFDFNIFFYQKSKFICFEILYIYPKVNLIKEHL